jgi:hypothetical protein
MMRHLSQVALMAATVALVASHTAPAIAEVPQSIGGTVKPTSDLPPLNLSDAQRERIRTIVGTQDTDVSFSLKNAKSSQSFEPSVGAKVPSGLKGHSFPPPLIYEMPTLKRYTYIKFKDRILVVNPMSGKIVDVMPIAKT